MGACILDIDFLDPHLSQRMQEDSSSSGEKSRFILKREGGVEDEMRRLESRLKRAEKLLGSHKLPMNRIKSIIETSVDWRVRSPDTIRRISKELKEAQSID
ncbi:MAG: hypothetical protein ACP5O5_07185 [Fervidicoccaceae archaeon]